MERQNVLIFTKYTEEEIKERLEIEIEEKIKIVNESHTDISFFAISFFLFSQIFSCNEQNYYICFYGICPVIFFEQSVSNTTLFGKFSFYVNFCILRVKTDMYDDKLIQTNTNTRPACSLYLKKYIFPDIFLIFFI